MPTDQELTSAGMATFSNKDESVVGLKPPRSLQISNETDMSAVWKIWIQQYQWYETATNLKSKSPEIQVATFMTIIGPEAVDIYNTFNLKIGDANNPEKIK